MHNLCGRAPGGWAFTLMLGFSLLVFSGQPLAPAYAAQSFTLEGPERSREGYFQLQVNGLDDDQAFIIELASAEDFSSIDATFSPLGSFRQLSLSGFDDGTYYFRARLDNNGEPGSAVHSNVLQVQVEHYPLWQALGLFGLGAVLFIALVTTLLRLHWHSRTRQTGNKEPQHGSDQDG